jgi:radical SAM protein with 4Fe4S-binding SPASM domain
MAAEDYNKNCTWKNVPEIGMIEITNACNFACVMCSNKLMTRKKGFISIATFKKALDRYSEAGIKFIKLYTTGESLLHPKFMRLWKMAVSYPFEKIMISTNASLLTCEMIEEFVKSKKFKIQISFSGWNDRSYEMRYAGGNFKQTVEKIKLLIKLIKKAGLPIGTLTINGVASASTGSIGKTKEFLIKEIGLDSKQLYIHSAHNWTEVVSDLGKDMAAGNSNLHKGKKYYCHIANTRIGILFDGKVTACGCLDVNGELIVGNIFKNSIAEIRKGKKFADFVNKLNTGNVSNLMCSKCNSLKWLR